MPDILNLALVVVVLEGLLILDKNGAAQTLTPSLKFQFDSDQVEGSVDSALPVRVVLASFPLQWAANRAGIG